MLEPQSCNFRLLRRNLLKFSNSGKHLFSVFFSDTFISNLYSALLLIMDIKDVLYFWIGKYLKNKPNHYSIIQEFCSCPLLVLIVKFKLQFLIYQKKVVFKLLPIRKEGKYYLLSRNSSRLNQIGFGKNFMPPLYPLFAKFSDRSYHATGLKFIKGTGE